MNTVPREIKFRGRRYVRTAAPQAPTGQTADQAYKNVRREIDKTLVALKTKLDHHATEQRREPKNWGYVGDLTHWLKKLQEIVSGGD